ncbi:hypothetical protein BDD12DRAFT_911591 [Trichophaea hybrida]|nr:hypothetical protein BDD12DRAFT_911591 [Trichophaea hybrida]
MVSTSDSDSGNPGSTPGRTSSFSNLLTPRVTSLVSSRVTPAIIMQFTRHFPPPTMAPPDQTIVQSNAPPAPSPTPMELCFLPAEIVSKIFDSLDSLNSAVSLACCSKFLAAVYNANKASIATRILPRDPILNGVSMSFYDKAVSLFLAQQQKEILGEYQGSVDVPSDLRAQFLKTPSLTTVHSILRLASIINRTAKGIRSRVVPRVSLDFTQFEVDSWKRYSFDILRRALYDVWTLHTLGGSLISPLFKGQRIKMWHQHPENEFVTGTFCHYLAVGQWDRFGMPNVEGVVPAARWPVLDPDLEARVRSQLVSECHSYSWNLLKKKKKVVVGVEGEVKVLQATVVKLSTRVEELEKSESALKERVCVAETLVEGMKAKLEERFGGEW